MTCDFIGVYPAVTTKFNANDEIDFDACMKGVQAQLDAGVHGIILGGTLGEASTLSKEEKTALLENTVKYVNGKVPIVMNIAEQTTKEAMNVAREAKASGASGLMLLPPMRYASDDQETLQYFKAIAAATDLPIMIYNNPVDYKIEVTLDMFDELQSCPTIRAVKETTRKITNVSKMISRFGDRFKIMCGLDTLGCEALLMGAHGWVAGLVCAFPKETVAIYELIKQDRRKEALEIYRWFIPLLELDINTKLVQNIKLAETAVGLGNEFVREPRLPLSGLERTNVQAIIDHGIQNRPTLPAL